MAVVDNHTHLDIRRDDLASPLRSDEGVAAALAVAAEVGVDRVVQVGCDLKSARWTVEILDDHPAMLGAVALHPNEAPRLADEGRLAEALAEIETLAADMLATMYDAPGVGLAAPQVGVQKRLFVWDLQDGNGPRSIVNPEIVESDGEWVSNHSLFSNG